MEKGRVFLVLVVLFMISVNSFFIVYFNYDESNSGISGEVARESPGVLSKAGDKLGDERDFRDVIKIDNERDSDKIVKELNSYSERKSKGKSSSRRADSSEASEEKEELIEFENISSQKELEDKLFSGGIIFEKNEIGEIVESNTQDKITERNGELFIERDGKEFALASSTTLIRFSPALPFEVCVGETRNIRIEGTLLVANTVECVFPGPSPYTMTFQLKEADALSSDDVIREETRTVYYDCDGLEDLEFDYSFTFSNVNLGGEFGGAEDFDRIEVYATAESVDEFLSPPFVSTNAFDVNKKLNCAQCSSGACCDNGNFRPSNYVCDSQIAGSLQSRCNNNCINGRIQERFQRRYCSGSSSACNGGIEQLEYTLTSCGSNYCSGPTDWQSNVNPFCESPQCSSGVCCDASCGVYAYKSSNVQCDAWQELSCPWGTNLGDDVGYRTNVKYCSGSSSACSGNVVNGPWFVADSCTTNEICVPGNANCQAGCESHNSFSCYDNDVYWYDSCNAREDKKQECGVSGFAGGNYCFDNDVYRDYVNRGCGGAECFENNEKIKQTECGALGCGNGQCNVQIECNQNSDCGVDGPIGSPFCSANNVTQQFRSFTCNSPGTPSSFCSSQTSQQTLEVCTSSCSNGQCITPPITCSQNSDCGTNGYVEDFYCGGPNTEWVLRKYRTYTCNNPGTGSSSCSHSETAHIFETCELGCSNGACVQPMACNQNSDCGINGLIGQEFCSQNDVKQVYRVYACNNPGTPSASCSFVDSEQIKQECFEDSCANWQNNYCKEQDVYRKRVCYDRGCSNAQCFFESYLEEEKVQECGNLGCSNGQCNVQIECNQNSDCGTNGFIGNPVCSQDDVKQTYRTWTCNNAGTPSASCSFSDGLQVKQDCGVDGCGNFGAGFCEDGDVYRQRTCNDRGCSGNACFNNANVEKEKVQECGNLGCSNGQCNVCVSECSAGTKRCSGNSAQSCGNYDADSCLEWGGDVSCQYGCNSGQCNAPPVCNQNSDCGTNGFIGNPVCSQDDVYGTYRTFVCNNPGTTNASCSQSDNLQKKLECGSDSCGSFGANFCFDNDVYKQRNCIDKGCSSGACFSNSNLDRQKVQECGEFGCSNGECKGKEMTINLPAGRSVFSLPLKPAGGSVKFNELDSNCAILRGGTGSICAGDNLAYLNPESGAYVCLDKDSELYPGQGYFIRVLNACSFTLEGEELKNNEIGYLGSGRIKQGENLIGALSKEVNFADVKGQCQVKEEPLRFVQGVSSCAGVQHFSGSEYCGVGIGGYNYCYCGVSRLIPGLGYNLHSNNQCTFI